MTPSLDELLDTMEMLADRKKYHAIDYYDPYEKQKEFHALGATKRERLLRAGNQIGKTYAGAAETTFHLTGQYPSWWKGRRFNRPVNAWVAGEGAVLTRDGPQRLLCGQPGVEGAFGTGFIPKDAFADRPSMSRGVTDAYDTIQVYHFTNGVKDGVSTLSFKSYDQGRQKFQTATLDFWWGDEEPPEEIYNELMARIQAVPDGFGFITFTPLKGMSTVVSKFITEISKDRSDTVMTLWDVPGMTQERVDKILAGYPKHQRDARTMGIPMQGSGRIFDYADEKIEEQPIPLAHIPEHWTKLWGIDFGIGHPFAAALTAWDRDADVFHILKTIRLPDALPLQHAASMKLIAANIPVAWPQDGTQRRDDGKPLSDQYKRQGLIMLPGHATFKDGSISTEAGILEIQQRIETGRLKVGADLLRGDFGNEFRMYHRDEDGQIVKIGDDIMSAVRIAVMSMRKGLALNILGGPGSPFKREQTREIADNVDFDRFRW